MARKFVNTRTVKNFQRSISDLIDSLGREITVVIDYPIVTGDWDPVNLENIDANAVLTYSGTSYVIDKAIVEWQDPLSFEYLPAGRIAPGDVRIRCRVADVLMSGDDINGDTIFEYARYMIVDGKTVKPFGKPSKSGLRDLFILDVWGKLVDTL